MKSYFLPGLILILCLFSCQKDNLSPTTDSKKTDARLDLTGTYNVKVLEYKWRSSGGTYDSIYINTTLTIQNIDTSDTRIQILNHILAPEDPGQYDSYYTEEFYAALVNRAEACFYAEDSLFFKKGIGGNFEGTKWIYRGVREY